jgi:uncharacterized protein (TIGR03435 family)
MKNIIIAALALGLAACGKPAEPAGDGKTAAAEQAAGPKKDAPAPELALPKIIRGDLKSVKSWDDLKGKAVVLEFWGTFCDPCVENIPHMNELAEAFKDKPVVFISVTRDGQAEVEKFMEKHPMKGNVAVEGKEAFRSFQVRGIPHTVLVDKDGVIRAFSYPSMVTTESIEALLAGSAMIPGSIVKRAPKEASAAPSAAGGSLASFSVNESDGEPSMSYGGGSFEVDGITLSYAIKQALRGYHGVKFIGVDQDLLNKKVKISAKTAPGPASDQAALSRLIISGLNGAFPLKIAVVKRDSKVYLLKKAAGATAVLAEGKVGSGRNGQTREEVFMKSSGAAMAELAGHIEQWLDEPVLDETGLGAKRFVLDFKASPVTLAAINAALKEKLGLHLVEARRNIEVVEVTGDGGALTARK